MYELSYPAVFKTRDDGEIVVKFPDLPEALTGANAEGEAYTEAVDCLQEALAGRMVCREEIPKASPVKRGQRSIPVALYLAPKVALYIALRESGLSNLEFAKRLGRDESIVRRMLNPKHNTKSDLIQNALDLLGKRLMVSVEDAA
jgi:antitoxin HicB